MKQSLYLAWRYLAYHRFKTAILITSITLIVYLPVGLQVLVSQSAEQLTSRAEATPLIVGAKGSPLELVLNTLYFESDTPEVMRYAEVTRIAESGLATPIPLYTRFQARRHPSWVRPWITLISGGLVSRRAGTWPCLVSASSAPRSQRPSGSNPAATLSPRPRASLTWQGSIR